MKRLIFLLFIQIHLCSSGQDLTSWLSFEDLQKYMAEIRSISRRSYQRLPYPEIMNEWEFLKKKHSDDGYSFTVVHLSNDETRVYISKLEVNKNTIYSRKDVVIERITTDMSWICKPDFDHCPIKLQVDSLRAQGGDYKSLMVEHIENHLSITKKDSVWAEFKSNKHYAYKDPLNSFPALTMDEIFKKISSRIQDESQVIPIKVNKTYGYIEYFSRHAIGEVEPPENESVQDYSVTTCFIVDFQWR